MASSLIFVVLMIGVATSADTQQQEHVSTSENLPEPPRTVVEAVEEKVFDYPMSRALGIDVDKMLHPDPLCPFMLGRHWLMR